MDENVKIIMAYAVIAVGPIIGSYAVVKNSSKLTSSLMGGMNKLGRSAAGALNKFAKNKYDRSTFGTIMATRKKTGDVAAKKAAYDRLSSGFLRPGTGLGKLARVGMGSRQASMFEAQVAGMDNAAYRDDVEAEQTRIGKEYINIDDAGKHFRDLATSGDASAVQIHAAMNHIAGFAGGKSTIHSLLSDQDVMKGIEKSEASGFEAYTGVQRGWAANKKFGAANPDMNAAFESDPIAYLHDAANGRANEWLGANYLGVSPDAGGKAQIPNSPPKDWGWQAVRPSNIISLAEKHTPLVYDKIKYADAITTSMAQDFGSADPKIRDMVNDIIAHGKADAAAKTAAARDAARAAGNDPSLVAAFEPDNDYHLPSGYSAPWNAPSTY